jgi:hypothetical protein
MLTVTPLVAIIAAALVGLLVLTVENVTSTVGIVMCAGIGAFYWVSHNPPSLWVVIVGLSVWLVADIVRDRHSPA